MLKRMLRHIRSALYSGNMVELGKIYGTDKVSEGHASGKLNRLDIYDKYFREFRGKAVNILEIGVLRGSSLKVWKRYFGKGRIYGLDIDPATKQYEEDRIFIEIGNQADEGVLNRISERAKAFDIIIDDGSHVNKHIIKSFEYLFAKLKNGGIYIIEDLRCTYDKLEEIDFGDGRKGAREIWPGMKYNNPDENLNNDRADMDKFFAKLIHDLDYHKRDISSVHFWSDIAVIIKAK